MDKGEEGVYGDRIVERVEVEKRKRGEDGSKEGR